MKFGLNFFPAFRQSDMSTADYFEQVLNLCEMADQLGYSSAKAVEHYFFDYGGHSTNPIVLLAAIAARTRRMRLITGAVIPAFNKPFKLAGELAMLDNISHGRLDAGFGRAFIPAEYDAHGVDMSESRARFEEGITVIKRLWTEDTVTFRGQFHTLKDMHLMPRPYQEPHPPIWIAATTTPESFTWAGQQGYNVMMVPFAGSLERAGELVALYRQAWRDAGWPPGQEQIQVSIHTYLAEDHDQAVEGFVRPFQRFLDVFVEAVSSWLGATPGGYAGYDRLVQGVRSMTPEKILEHGLALVGTPEEVVDQIEYLTGFLGEIEPSLQPNFANISEPEATRTLTLFADKVMPRFSARPLLHALPHGGLL